MDLWPTRPNWRRTALAQRKPRLGVRGFQNPFGEPETGGAVCRVIAELAERVRVEQKSSYAVNILTLLAAA